MAILQLWEGDHLDLDEPVTTYLPYFSIKGSGADRVTVRQMLNHTSGLPDLVDDTAWRHPEFDDGALERFVRSLADEEMAGTPGEGFIYSNEAYEVLGDVIAKVSGQTFEAYVKAHILQPLGMTDSTFLRSEVNPVLATTPHCGAPLTVLGDAYPYNRAHAPSSSLHSSAADMCRWMLANLAKGELDGRRVLRDESHETLWRRTVEIVNENPTDEAICLGWFSGTYREEPIMHHGGSDPGFFADLFLLPEREMGMMVMSNVYCASAWSVADAAMDIMLGLEPVMPKRPITVSVGAVLRAAGQDAAITEYRRLKTEADDEYDFDEHHFSHVTGSAVWLQRPDAVMPLLLLRTALFPESAGAFEELGEAYLVSGNLSAAERNLQTALALEPESESIPKLLQRVEGE
jgi:CubicO group peptidase (beta-lactamase class C family)